MFTYQNGCIALSYMATRSNVVKVVIIWLIKRNGRRRQLCRCGGRCDGKYEVMTFLQYQPLFKAMDTRIPLSFISDVKDFLPLRRAGRGCICWARQSGDADPSEDIEQALLHFLANGMERDQRCLPPAKAANMDNGITGCPGKDGTACYQIKDDRLCWRER